jgi:hypothetical protein
MVYKPLMKWRLMFIVGGGILIPWGVGRLNGNEIGDEIWRRSGVVQLGGGAIANREISEATWENLTNC